MKKLQYNKNTLAEELAGFLDRTAFSRSIDTQVESILKDVKAKGDNAVIKYAQKFDKMHLTPNDFRVTQDEIKKAGTELHPDIKEAINTANDNISEFAAKRLPESWNYNPRSGVTLGERYTPLQRVVVP